MCLFNVLPVTSNIVHKIINKTQRVVLRQIFKSHGDDFIFFHVLDFLRYLFDVLLDLFLGLLQIELRFQGIESLVG